MKRKQIQVFEHQRLYVGEKGFQQKHLNALLKLNEYHDWKYFKPIAQGIQFNQYVGVIQVDGLLIEIHPKVDKYDSDSHWQKVLLQMLQACGKLKASSVGEANVSSANLNLLELYFELFLSEVQMLIHRGFVKKYRKQTQNTKALKGKLEFAGHVQKNLVHKERFYTTHQVYDTDHLLHQILYKALQIVTGFTKGTRLYDLCKRVGSYFPETSLKPITKQQIASIKLNRKTEVYKDAFELARLIILNYSPDISGGREKMLSLLFDMNLLWEEYVFTELKKIEKEKGISVEGQDSKFFWSNKSLRPDIIVQKGDKKVVVDTKWKCPDNNAASVTDLRQMYTYCRFWKAEKALLLYPGEPIDSGFIDFETDDFIFPDQKLRHQCKMGFVSVLDNQKNLSTKVSEEVLRLLQLD